MQYGKPSAEGIEQISLRLSTWLEEARFRDSVIRRKALDKIERLIAPWELLEGCGSWEHLMIVAETPFSESAVPLLIDLLRDDAVEDKDLILEILHNLSRFLFVGDEWIPVNKRDSFRSWAKHLRELIAERSDVFVDLTRNETGMTQVMAKELIELLSI